MVCLVVTMCLAFSTRVRAAANSFATPQEAVRAFQVCGAEFALGHHYGTFQLTNEAIDAPVEALIKARVEAEIEPDRFRLLKPGQVWGIEARAVA